MASYVSSLGNSNIEIFSDSLRIPADSSKGIYLKPFIASQLGAF